MHHLEIESAQRWYVVHTHARQEDRAEENLRAWNIETFSPRIRERRHSPFTGEPLIIVKPLFPSYLFAHLDLTNLYHKIRYTRGVHSLVSVSDAPVPLDDEIIRIIRARIGKDGFVKIGEEFNRGDAIVIQDGALKGFTGVFVRHMKESERVMVLLNTVSFQALVQLSRGLIRKISQTPVT